MLGTGLLADAREERDETAPAPVPNFDGVERGVRVDGSTYVTPPQGGDWYEGIVYALALASTSTLEHKRHLSMEAYLPGRRYIGIRKNKAREQHSGSESAYVCISCASNTHTSIADSCAPFQALQSSSSFSGPSPARCLACARAKSQKSPCTKVIRSATP